MKKRPKILILGAGMAGLACAKKLQEQGFSVTVLEARSRIGGRIWTDRTSGFPVDLGASALHDVQHNPLVKKAKKQHLHLKKAEWANVALFDKDGKQVSGRSVKGIIKECEKLITKSTKKFTHHQYDISLEKAMRRIDGIHNFSPKKMSYFEWAKDSRAVISAADLKNLSVKHYDESSVLETESDAIQEGADKLLEDLAKGLDIRLKQEVISIHWNIEHIEVHTKKSHFRADMAVVTLPLGVLKKGKIKFHPPLPAEKKSAIRRLGMGVLNKVVLVYAKPPKPMKKIKKDFWGFVTKHEGELPNMLNLYRPEKLPVLIGFIGGKKAERFESLSDQAIKEAVMSELQRAFGDKIPMPTHFFITRWQADPYSYGSYSYLPPKASPNDYELLAKPVANRVFFAGEATEKDHSATMQGAYISGLREADRITLMYL